MDEKYECFKEVNERAKFLLEQLAKGKYKSLDVYANNLRHLTVNFREFSLYTSDIDFLIWIQIRDPGLLKEILMTGKFLLIICNFFHLAALSS